MNPETIPLRTIVRCLGGWCARRDECAHYHSRGIDGREPIERLCGDVSEPVKPCGGYLNELEWRFAGE